jgi:hypothetical protein
MNPDMSVYLSRAAGLGNTGPVQRFSAGGGPARARPGPRTRSSRPAPWPVRFSLGGLQGPRPPGPGCGQMPMRPARKASTATLVAAFRAVGQVPPRPGLAKAYSRQWKAAGPGPRSVSRPRVARSRGVSGRGQADRDSQGVGDGDAMSGGPSWASMEQSSYSTREWTMLCGCTTTFDGRRRQPERGGAPR